MTCPAAQTPLYVRPLSLRSGIKGLGRGTGTCADVNALICRYLFGLTGETALSRPYIRGEALRFRSLRLSVRTPPFHGGESGSIPLGSAKHLNGLAPCPAIAVFAIATPRSKRGCCAKVSARSEIRNPSGYSLTVQQGSRSLRTGARDRWCTMRDEFASKSFLAVTVAGFVLLCSGLVAFAFN